MRGLSDRRRNGEGRNDPPPDRRGIPMKCKDCQKKIAFELKVSDAPHLTKGFWEAIKETKPEITFVVSPLAEKYPITDNVMGIGIKELFLELKNLKD